MSARPSMGSDPLDDYMPPKPSPTPEAKPEPVAPVRPKATTVNRKRQTAKRRSPDPAPGDPRQKVTVYFDLEEYAALEKLWLQRRREAAPGERRGFADLSTLVREAVRATYVERR